MWDEPGWGGAEADGLGVPGCEPAFVAVAVPDAEDRLDAGVTGP